MGKPYEVSEVFTSIQGEGVDSGERAVFIRMANCNLSCEFCDTNFPARFLYTVEQLLELTKDTKLVVITGGEPLLQCIEPLVAKLVLAGHRLNIETNGTMPVPEWLTDSISLSPKISRTFCRVPASRSLKILFPYLDGVTAYQWLDFPAQRKYLQLTDFRDMEKNDKVLKDALAELYRLPDDWVLGVQLHKFLKVV